MDRRRLCKTLFRRRLTVRRLWKIQNGRVLCLSSISIGDGSWKELHRVRPLSSSPPIEFTPTLCRVRPHTFRVRPHQVEFAPWLSDIQMSWFVTKALAECAKCHVSDDHFEFRQLRGTCLGTGLTESTKYSAWDLGLPEITVYTELVIKRTTRFI